MEGKGRVDRWRLKRAGARKTEYKSKDGMEMEKTYNEN